MNQERTTHDIDNDELTIDLGELFSVLWNKIYIIILAGIVLTSIPIQEGEEKARRQRDVLQEKQRSG